MLSAYYPASAIRRLGFLIENYSDASASNKLRLISDSRKTAISLLDPQSGGIGTVDKRWQLKINKEVLPDV